MMNDPGGPVATPTCSTPVLWSSASSRTSGRGTLLDATLLAPGHLAQQVETDSSPVRSSCQKIDSFAYCVLFISAMRRLNSSAVDLSSIFSRPSFLMCKICCEMICSFSATSGDRELKYMMCAVGSGASRVVFGGLVVAQMSVLPNTVAQCRLISPVACAGKFQSNAECALAARGRGRTLTRASNAGIQLVQHIRGGAVHVAVQPQQWAPCQRC